MIISFGMLGKAFKRVGEALVLN